MVDKKIVARGAFAVAASTLGVSYEDSRSAFERWVNAKGVPPDDEHALAQFLLNGPVKHEQLEVEVRHERPSRMFLSAAREWWKEQMKMEDREDMKLQLEIEEKMLRIQEKRLELEAKRQQLQKETSRIVFSGSHSMFGGQYKDKRDSTSEEKESKSKRTKFSSAEEDEEEKSSTRTATPLATDTKLATGMVDRSTSISHEQKELWGDQISKKEVVTGTETGTETGTGNRR